MKLNGYNMLKNTLVSHFQQNHPTDLFLSSEIYYQVATRKALCYADNYNKEFQNKYTPHNNVRQIIDSFFAILESMQESTRNSILKEFFDLITPSRGHALLASLIEKGLFRTIITTTVDSMLEQALADLNLVINRDFKVFVVGGHREDRFGGLFMSYNQRIPKIIKLYGDTSSNIVKFSREELLLIPELVIKTLQQHTKDTLFIVGYNERDVHALTTLNKKGLPVFFAHHSSLNPENPVERRAVKFLLDRDSYEHQITGERGSFDEIFLTLHRDLVRAGILQVTPPLDQRDVIILSITKVLNESYQISLETREYPLSPLKAIQEYEVSSELRNEIAKKMDIIPDLVSSYVGDLNKMSGEMMFQEIKKLGSILFRCYIPPEYRDMPKTEYLILETSEPYIPWELMYSDTFFALTYAFGRRLTSGISPARKRILTSERKALVISDPGSNLPYTLKEGDFIAQELEAFMNVTYYRQSQATKINILHELSQSYDIIHFAGHAQYGKKPGIHLVDGILTPGEIVHHLEGNPIVFINACSSAKERIEKFESIAQAFLQSGAFAYIGNIWNIHDKLAAEIALEFYKETLVVPLGEAMRKARKKCFSKNNMAWASPVLYGDPRLQLV
ncbi:MAG: CHAT domain-containing protein [Theionarchaea archaeon]|nr:CHAT domain-containing protein [Theionarchaea archaeon]